MARRKNTMLSVEAEGKRRFISVPASRAKELHDYLRSNKVRSAPPEPAYTGVDNIELAHDIDVGGVQALLDDWS